MIDPFCTQRLIVLKTRRKAHEKTRVMAQWLILSCYVIENVHDFFIDVMFHFTAI